MNNVENPIIIDQYYCDSKQPCDEQVEISRLYLSSLLAFLIQMPYILQESAVQVSNVVYKNVKGTSASDAAIDFECSKSVP